MPGAGRAAGPHRRARVVLSWPLANIGPSLPNLLATVAGNLFELKYFSGLRLLDLRLPEEFARAYAGPGFGVAGTRALTGVEGRPLIGTIIKPSVGLSAEETAAKIGTKLIFPLVLCLWPSFFLVAIGPAIIGVLKVFGKV